MLKGGNRPLPNPGKINGKLDGFPEEKEKPGRIPQIFRECLAGMEHRVHVFFPAFFICWSPSGSGGLSRCC
ncbi:hypothetical protein CXU21_10085 [Akkermansia muciniphila]|jgi:hypothetical protein|nr:hypothetical protein CXU21_10085 [Akkermansia muciniphila]